MLDGVSRLRVPMPLAGFGAAQLGNLFRETSDAEAAGAVDAAWAAGIRYYDTAPHYGLGLSERRLGSALADRARAEMLVSTKVGRLLVPSPETADVRDDEGFAVPAAVHRVWDFSADGVRRSLDASLDRLGLDRIDIVYVHDPDDHGDAASSSAIPALIALREQGIVDAISAEEMGKFPDTNLAESLQRITGVSIDRSNGEGSFDASAIKAPPDGSPMSWNDLVSGLKSGNLYVNVHTQNNPKGEIRGQIGGQQ